MALEKLIEELIDAVNANTKAVDENSDLLKGMTAKARAATEDKGGSTSRSSTKDDDKGKDDKEKTTRTRKAKAPTQKELTEKTQKFLDVDSDEVYQERRDVILTILDKFKPGGKMGEIEPEEDRIAAGIALDLAIAGEDPFPKTRRSRDDVA